jgi:Fic family protein
MPHSIQPDFLAGLAYSAADVSTLRTLGEFRGKQVVYQQQRPEVLESMRKVAQVESMESSNRLEGIVADKGRIERLALRDEPANRSEQEIAGYRDALALVHESGAEMPFRPSVILQMHGLVFRYQPDEGGRWKSADNSIVETDERGEVARVRFEAVSAVLTPQAVDDLTAQYESAIDGRGEEHLVVVPLTILDFLCIHPFRDGNGRVARLLTLQVLYRFGYEVGRYVSLERIFEETKESYYETLELSSRGWHESNHDPMPWTRYFWGVLLRAYREFEERAGNIATHRGSKSDRVRAAVARRTLPFRISELERDCPGVGRDTVRKVLRELRDQGKLAAEGTGPGARWRPLDAD